MQNDPEKSPFLNTGVAIALGAGLGILVSLFTDLGISWGLIIGAGAGLLASLFAGSRRS